MKWLTCPLSPLQLYVLCMFSTVFCRPTWPRVWADSMIPALSVGGHTTWYLFGLVLSSSGRAVVTNTPFPIWSSLPGRTSKIVRSLAWSHLISSGSASGTLSREGASPPFPPAIHSLQALIVGSSFCPSNKACGKPNKANLMGWLPPGSSPSPTSNTCCTSPTAWTGGG